MKTDKRLIDPLNSFYGTLYRVIKSGNVIGHIFVNKYMPTKPCNSVFYTFVELNAFNSPVSDSLFWNDMWWR